MTGEGGERLTGQGPRGAQGNQGNRGEQGAAGLSRSVRRSLVVMFALAVILAASGLFWINHEAHANRAAVQAEYVREQAAQRSQGQAVERKLCTTLNRLAALKPPSGPAASNPSRAYEDDLHMTLDQLGPDIGCK